MTNIRLTTVLLLLLQPIFVSAAEEPERTQDTQASQPSRVEEVTNRRQEKLATVKPAPANKLANFLATVENDGFDQFITLQLDHFRFGFGKISPASSFTPAIEYERPRLGGSSLTLRTSGAYSINGYHAYDFKLGKFDQPAPPAFLGQGFLGAPFLFDRRTQKKPEAFLYADLQYRNFPREEFFGLGPDSLESDRTDYRLEEGSAAVVAGWQFTRWLAVQGRFGYVPTDVKEGENDRLQDSEDLFDPGTVPGLDEQADFLQFEAGLYMAWIGDPNTPGAELGIRLGRYDDTDGDRFDFNRFSIDGRAAIPLGSRQRTLAFRLYTSMDTADQGSEVPFYLMQTLGGTDMLRGFREFRFRDKNLLYLSAEYRWEAAPAVELAAFYDTGKVASERSDLGFNHLRHGFGAGIRFKSYRRVVFRIDIGHSEEGTFAHIALGPSF